ncbi:hypothetical protein P152DRAFT_268487 [Eremomyces bilateralis CBS 781.70]|uniref:ORC6 first cyclin-like domain-containing protein n=1 Tax=Eremomyces bilateralis CBS 781.70 TaxID=1392243 RepID=A0A6G1G8I9_9PEZI|nr:uncharacterized protein P152DRAFT_268487 [Eremomyces bilateralis CBS 781.70]KAF1814354.1 hypothetical protein P152DRAFT_268487 [Eremomyces bilateralis CBS 781.70]
MNRPVEQALTSLLPSLTGPPPPDLVSLAHSLLAQSRSKASTLKSEEEIARTYACAHLACEKLKQRLNLPKIEARPPCGPRVYKKVFNYLSTALASVRGGQEVVTGTQKELRSRNPKALESSPTATRSRLAIHSASKAKVSSSSVTPRKRSLLASNDAVKDIPQWALPMVRRLCGAFHLAEAAPHVFAGLESILSSTSRAETPNRRRSRRLQDDEGESQSIGADAIPALIIAILLYAVTKITGETISGKVYLKKRAQAVTVASQSAGTSTMSEAEMNAEIDGFLRRAQSEGWLDMEWYQNIDEPEDVDELDALMQADEDGPTDGTLSTSANGATSTGPSVGSILSMHDAVDWVGEERKHEYRQWERGIMDRIAKIEREEKVKVNNG